MDYIIENAVKNSGEQSMIEIGQANIKVIGVGGAGNNMVGWLFNKGTKGAEIIARFIINVLGDLQLLKKIKNEHKEYRLRK